MSFLSKFWLAPLLVNEAGRNEMVKWCLKGRLRIVKQGLPAIPPSRAQSARGIHKAVEIQREILVGCIRIAGIIYRVLLRIV
jgi:hypothetical protein